MRLPEQYETRLGERGAQLSGGERQRISVARAFLKDAPICILDEPTSSIDSRTEAVILDSLERLMVGRTTFMIAHRLSTVRNADLILVLNHGSWSNRAPTTSSWAARASTNSCTWPRPARHSTRRAWNSSRGWSSPSKRPR